MYQILSPYYSQFHFVETYFIEFDNTLQTDYVIDKDVLKIRGVESLVPGLLIKTIDAILILKKIGKSFNWVIRSNVSTVVNFDKLKCFLDNYSFVNYFGGHVYNLQWTDAPFGIVDDKYFGLDFAQGTLIGFSNFAVEKILDNRHKFRFDIIDDVSFAIFFKENAPFIKCCSMPNGLVFVENQIQTAASIKAYNNQYSPVAWRNKGVDRNIDLINMRLIIEMLQER